MENKNIFLKENQIKFLESISISSIKKKNQNLISIQSDETIANALEILSKSHITSAPVFDEQNHQFIGFVDVLDIAVFVISVFAENYYKHPHLYDPKELNKRFFLPVKEVINASNRDPFYPIDSNQNLSFLISNFLRFGVHRIPIKENDKIIGIISQSDIIRFLYQNYHYFENIMNLSLSQLGIDKGNVISVTNDVPFIKVFTTILKHKISGVAVVDMKNGTLVNNISASDLKGLTQQTFYKLEVPIHQIFLYNDKNLPPITCKKYQTLYEVLQLITQFGVHRVFIIDDDQKPINVLTLTNILTLFSPTI